MFGLYDAERENRERVNKFAELIGIDLKHIEIDIVNEKLSRIITKNDAAKLAKILSAYAES